MRLVVGACVVALVACSGTPTRRGPDSAGPNKVVQIADTQDLALSPREVRLATSHTYTCSIEATDKLYCWGAQGVGREMPPTQLGGTVRYIVAGKEPYGPLCTINTDGVGACMGLGVRDAIDVGVGSRYACILDRRGRVQCAGAVDGEPPAGGATQLAVGPTHACVRLDDGGVYCWGDSSLGPVGVPPKNPQLPAPASGRVKIDNVAGIAAGTVVSCAWKTDGTAWCWGDTAFNGLGSLGTGTQHAARFEPVQVPGLRDVVSISVGGNHTVCAIDRAGALWCWGHDYQGTLGANVQGDSGPVRVAFNEAAAEVSIGGTHACLRARSGSVWCWGGNEWGQVGDAERGSTWQPRQVAVTTPASPPPPVAISGPVITTLPSGAHRVELALTSAESLKGAGWRRVAGGRSTFSNNALHIEANGFEEWSLAVDRFVRDAGNGPQWAVEAKLQLDEPCGKLGTGFWIHDGFHHLTVRINDHEIATSGLRKDIGSTATPRIVRVAFDRGSIDLAIDGTSMGKLAASEGHASKALMFGVLGDGCGRDRSTWHYIAYETFPEPPRAWPSRMEWHPGTTSDLIAKSLPVAARAHGKGIDPACLAIEVLDAGVRDLLAVAYRGVNAPSAARQLTTHDPLTTAQGRKSARDHLARLMTEQHDPICTPPPGGHCGNPRQPRTPEPVPPIAHRIAAALVAADKWGDHPKLAERSTQEIGAAYADAITSNIGAGASAAEKRLVNRIKALAKDPRCVANPSNKRATP